MSGWSLAVARCALGLLLTFSAARTLANGWITSLYAGPTNRFTYPMLGWIPKPSVPVMALLVVLIGVGGVLTALGVWWRWALGVALAAFTWIEFIDVTTYLNHYWFVSLFGVLVLCAPADEQLAPHARRRTVPVGWIWLLRGQVAVVYAFAGAAKLNRDWLFHALPLRLWLPTRAHLAVIGPLLDQRATPYVMSWAGALFDCLVMIALLWRRTRLGAWLAVVAFHVVTWRLFAIGVFPWMMIAATTVFFEPDWPQIVKRRMARWAVRQRWVRRQLLRRRALRRWTVNRWVRTRRKMVISRTTRSGHPRRSSGRPRQWSGRLTVGAVAWMVVQLMVPMRHWVIPGDTTWTSEGYRLSWNVLRTERAGDVTFRVTDPATGVTWRTSAQDRYTALQWKAMTAEPELIRQAAHTLASEYDGDSVEVRVDAYLSVNGRAAARLIDPDVDLAAEPWRWHQPWILEAPPR